MGIGAVESKLGLSIEDSSLYSTFVGTQEKCLNNSQVQLGKTIPE